MRTSHQQVGGLKLFGEIQIHDSHFKQLQSKVSLCGSEYVQYLYITCVQPTSHIL